MKKECIESNSNRLCRLKNKYIAFTRRRRERLSHLHPETLDDLVGGVVTRGAALGDVTALDELGDVTTDEGVTGAVGVDEVLLGERDDGVLADGRRRARRRSRPRLA